MTRGFVKHMLKFCRIAIALAIPVFVAGCASGVKERLEAAEENAPTWYEQQKQETIDRGYPEFSSIPTESQRGPIPQHILDGEAQLDAELEALESDPKAKTALEDGLEDPSVWAQRMRDEVEKGILEN